MSEPTYVFCGSEDWGDPYIVSLIMSGLAHWSWQHSEKIAIATTEVGVGRDVRNVAALYNADPSVYVSLDVHTASTNEAILADEGVKIIIAFANDLTTTPETVDLMARGLLANKVVYHIRRVQP